MPENPLILLRCERGDLNPHALRHWILSPARLPFRHSRAAAQAIRIISSFEAADRRRLFNSSWTRSMKSRNVDRLFRADGGPANVVNV
jgi:hypothetical protein